MKKLLLLVIAIFSLFSCGGDDPNPQIPPIVNAGSFKHNGITYPVNRGYLIPVYGGNDPQKDYYKDRFYLGFSDGTITWGDNYFVVGDDVHQWIDFSLDTSTVNRGTVKDTSFTFATDDDLNPDAARISSANIIYDIVAENGQTVEYINHDANTMSATGSLQLTRLGNGIYKINYEFVDDDGDTVTGSYIGTLTTLYYPWL
ncbi:MAG TPA: hypothetical protein PLS51_01160 [Flavobacterium sp.]|nr:hypothetical protein [Flavobacterium sp.]HPJ09208.1 hypothetical protein [Flavobacterium sp.]